LPKYKAYKIIEIGQDFGDAPFGTSLKTKDYVNHGIPVIQGRNIRDQKFVWNHKLYVSENKFNSLKRSHCRAGDLVFPKIGNRTVGSCALVPSVEGNETFLLSTNLMKMSVKPEIAYLKYVYYYFCLPQIRGKIISIAGGGAQPIFNFTTLKGFDIELPSLFLQQKIASILSVYDDLIENNTRRIQVLEEMAQRIYREWFVKFRYPGHENQKLVEPDLGMIPEEWEVKELGEKINFIRGKNITKREIIPGHIPVVAAGINPAYYHNKSNVDAPVVTISASGANAGFVRLYSEDIWASDCSYISKESVEFIYYYYTQLIDRQIEITALQRGSAQPHVYPKDLVRMLIVDPPVVLLLKFEELAIPIFEEIGNLKLKNINLQKTRDLLLPKLISGKLDVSELDIDTGIEE